MAYAQIQVDSFLIFLFTVVVSSSVISLAVFDDKDIFTPS